MKCIVFLLFILPSTGSFAQGRSYQNKNAATTETITFCLQGNIIVDGEWEHVSNNPNTSGEVNAFTGKTVNNKLVITPVPAGFSHYTVLIQKDVIAKPRRRKES